MTPRSAHTHTSGPPTRRLSAVATDARARLRSAYSRRTVAKARAAGTGAPRESLVILSYGRSGSTVLQHLANTLEGVCVRGEHLGAALHLYRADRALREAQRHYVGRDNHRIAAPFYGLAHADPDALAAAVGAAFVAEVLRPPPGTTMTGFKEVRFTPGYVDGLDDLVGYCRWLDRALPTVRLVVNVRDPQATSRSGWWPGVPDALEQLTVTRERLVALVEVMAAELGEDRCVLADWDRWHDDPGALAGIFARLGLAVDAAQSAAVLGVRLDHMHDFATDRGAGP